MFECFEISVYKKKTYLNFLILENSGMSNRLLSEAKKTLMMTFK